MKEFSKNNPKVACFVRGYRGRRTVKVETQDVVGVSDYWDGGSRTDTHFCSLSGDPAEGVEFEQQKQGNPFNLRVGSVKTRPGLVVVQHSIFCGKDMGYRLFVSAEDYERF